MLGSYDIQKAFLFLNSTLIFSLAFVACSDDKNGTRAPINDNPPYSSITDTEMSCSSSIIQSSSSESKTKIDTLGMCNAENQGKINLTSTPFYICDKNEWRRATNEEYNTSGYPCSEAELGTTVNGIIHKTKQFFCDVQGWREVSKENLATKGSICTDSLQDIIIKGNNSLFYYCDKGAWREATATEYNTYGIECVHGDSVKGLIDTSVEYYCRTDSLTGELTWSLFPIIESKTCGKSSNSSFIPEENIIRCAEVYEKPEYWFTENDSADGGKSTITWQINEDSDNVEGSVELNKNLCDFDPYVAIGYLIGGKDDKGNPITVDATSLGGICIRYNSDINIQLEMSLDERINKLIDYALPAYSLPKNSGSPKCLKWSDFRQPSWYKGDGKITGEEAAKIMQSLNFKIQGKTGSRGKFNIAIENTYF